MNDGYEAVPGVQTTRMVAIISVIVIIFCAYLVVSALITYETTGLIYISSAQKANIIVSRTDSQAKTIGNTDKAKVRLKPGTYQIESATSSGQVAVRTVSIKKKQSTKVSLTPATSPKLPSVNSISFFGTSALTDLGINSAQLDLLRLDFFYFRPSAGTVSISTQSVKTLPHNLGDPFVIAFNVSVDSQTYNAKISYEDTKNIQLQLYDHQGGKLVYDSYSAPSYKSGG